MHASKDCYIRLLMTALLEYIGLFIKIVKSGQASLMVLGCDCKKPGAIPLMLVGLCQADRQKILGDLTIFKIMY